MVQLPATAAIEYVAPCWVSGDGGIFVRGTFVRGVFCPGGLLSGGGGLCPFPPSSLRIRTVQAFCAQHRSVTDKQKKTDSAPQLLGEQTPAPQIFRVCRGGGTLHISSKHYMELGPKKNPKSRFCHEANEYMSPQRRHENVRNTTIQSKSLIKELRNTRYFWDSKQRTK